MAPSWARKLESRLKVTRRGASPETTLTSPRTSMSSQTKPESAPQSTSSHSYLTIQERLWNQAYDDLKTIEARTVEAYEKLLSSELQAGSGNKIGQSLEARSSQMQQLVQLGLERTKKIATIQGLVADGLDVVDSLKGIIDQAVNASPEASIAWAGISFGIEILANPVKQAAVNRSGIAYVISRMNWYWDLAGLLLDENTIQKSSAGLRARLEEHIIELYQKLLLFQIKCACLYYQNQGIVLLKDMLKLDDWESQIQDIKDAEAAVQRDSEQYNSEQVKLHLHDLAVTAHSQETKLGDVFLAIRDNAKQQERRHEDDEDKQCLKDLYVTDPREDKISLQETKGGLLEDSYHWILDHVDFQRFRSDPQSRLLWIKGDPGKGKTMLLCGIIDELEKESASLLSYYFCQATKVQLSDAIAVLRGLIFLLIVQQPQLISYVRTKYDIAGSKLFEGTNVWISMTEILTNMLKDPNLEDIIILPTQPPGDSRAKWIVSSRNWPDIEEQLADASNIRVQLELNADSISSAVHMFIQYKVDQLTHDKKYDTETSAAVQRHLVSNADGTFLWVALVCQMLANPKVRKWQTLTKLKSFPPGLDSLYKRMLMYISDSDDADLCKEILAIVSIVYRPITLEELKSLVQSLEEFDSDDLEKVVALCGSFLTIKNGVVLFVHQSAKDYLLDEAVDEIFPSGIAHQHHVVFSRSLDVISRSLRRDIYDLRKPGVLIEEVVTPDPDPLASVRYSCVFWVDHLGESRRTQGKEYDEALWDGGAIHKFLQKSYLYWLEGLSLLKGISDGVRAVQKLESLIGNTRSQYLRELVQDARRFILYHRSGIENAPLQVYASALVFSPTKSLIRELFKGEEPDWIVSKPKVEENWGACVLTLEDRDESIAFVAFSADGQWIVSASNDYTINVWDTSTGACISSFKDNEQPSRFKALMTDGQKVASVSRNGTINIWSVASGACMSVLDAFDGEITLATFSGDGRTLALVLNDCTIRIWDVIRSVIILTLEGYSEQITSVTLSMDGQRFVSGSPDSTCKIWDVDARVCISTLEGHSGEFLSVFLSGDGQRVASASFDSTVKIWDVATGAYLSTLQRHGQRVVVRQVVAISWDGQHVATSAFDGSVQIWDATTGVCTSTFKGHGDGVTSISFSSDGRWIVSGSYDCTIKLWDASIGMSELSFEGHSGPIRSFAISTDGQRVVAGSFNGPITVWDTATGVCILTLEGHVKVVNSVVFSADGQQVASGSWDGTTKIWDMATSACKLTLCNDEDEEHDEDADKDPTEYHHIEKGVLSVVFSADGRRVASKEVNGSIKIWDMATGTCISRLKRNPNRAKPVALSTDGQRVVFKLWESPIEIWDVVTKECVSTLKDPSHAVGALAFSADGNQVASSLYTTVKIWDVATGTCTSTLEVGLPITRLSFDRTTNSRLFTSAGALDLAINPMADRQITDALSSGYVRRGYGIGTGYTWITKDENRMLWLPAEYRRVKTDVGGSTVVMGSRSNCVLIMQFS
ncbi:hypothetical protein DPV78_003938 [Talaromyces pinophilus]|nr:hypothetical protein DPV78_003938 [Talaromyces pinophilus]